MQAAARALLDDSAAGALLVAEADGSDARRGVQPRDRRRARRQLADRDSRAGPLRADPGPVGAPRLARQGGRRWAAAGAVRARCASMGIARVEVGLPRERFEGLAATEAFYLRIGFEPLGARMRLEAAVSELLLVEQRPGRHDEAPWVLEGGRRLPGHDDNRRLVELRRGCCATRGVRAFGADADRRAGRADAERAARARLPARRSGGSAPTSRWCSPSWRRPACRPTSRSRAGLVAAAHEAVRTGDHRGAAPRRRGRASPTRSAARPATTPAPAGWPATATSTPPRRLCRRCATAACGRSGCSTSTCTTPTAPPRSSRSAGDVHLHSLHAWPVTNVPSLTVRPRSGARTGGRVPSASRIADEYLDAVAASIDALAQSTCRALVLSLGLRHGRGRPARLLEPSAGGLRARRPPARRFGAAGVRDPGGRLRAAVRSRRAADAFAHRPARGGSCRRRG